VGLSPTAIATPVRIERGPDGTSPLFFYITASIVEDSGSRIRTAAAVIPT
jgi:hypothetical protein